MILHGKVGICFMTPSSCFSSFWYLTRRFQVLHSNHQCRGGQHRMVEKCLNCILLSWLIRHLATYDRTMSSIRKIILVETHYRINFINLVTESIAKELGYRSKKNSATPHPAQSRVEAVTSVISKHELPIPCLHLRAYQIWQPAFSQV